MKKLTSKKVKEYMSWRTDEELKHCPDCIAAACNDAAIEFNHDSAKDLMRLLFFPYLIFVLMEVTILI